MCGIAGVIRHGRIVADDRALLDRLCDSMAHRGPDGEGKLVNDHVAFGMRRLSIIDLAGGWQPLYNEDKSIALVANGEVYNYVELRADLIARGHQFRTNSDCETIAHLYEEYGDDFVHKLRGMYAFALWDDRRKRLLVVRDRLGEKPLYLARFGDRIVFASEMKPLLRARVVPFELDPDGVHLYMHYELVPEPLTAVRGIEKLRAGHMLIVEPASWNVRTVRYWSFDDIPPLDVDPVEAIRAELETIGNIVTRSDVPVGVTLSGGFDSSSVVALAARSAATGLTAITVGYEGSSWQDESADAQQTARHLKLPLLKLTLRPAEMIAGLARTNYDRDDPIADPSGPSYGALMQAAANAGLKVLLYGQGGDELFWGYPLIAAAERENARRRRFQAGSAGLLDYLRVRRPPVSFSGASYWARDLGGLGTGLKSRSEDRRAGPGQIVFYEPNPWYRDRRSAAARAMPAEFLAQVRRPDASHVADRGERPANDRVELMRLVSEIYLRENGMAQADRLGMAYSVETRLPLCDYRLFEVAVGLEKAGRASRSPKAVLREAMRPYLPQFVYDRPKRAFTPPWRLWTNLRAKMYGDRVLDGELVRRGVITRDAARRIVRPVGRYGLLPPLSNVVFTLELWCDAMRDMIAGHAPPPRAVAADVQRIDP